jgi:hypothetical protein
MATSPEDATAAERFRVALDLYATGEAMMRQRICREHPELSSSEVEDRLCAWLQTRPGAEHGDAVGRSVPWPRPK